MATPDRNKPPAPPIEEQDPRSVQPPSVSQLRKDLNLNQPDFARLFPISVQSLATFETGATPSDSVHRRLVELERLTNALAEVVQKLSLGAWLTTPNPTFDGLKPLEVIERGESDRLWSMIHFLRSGVPV
jgi:DNA-binding XRE family transcriptional regulator